MKNIIKNSLLIGSKAFAELFLQNSSLPSSTFAPGASSIISLTTSLTYEHPLSFSSFLIFSPLFHFFPPVLPSFHSLLPTPISNNGSQLNVSIFFTACISLVLPFLSLSVSFILKAPYFTPFLDLLWGIGPLRWYISGLKSKKLLQCVFPCPLFCLSLETQT